MSGKQNKFPAKALRDKAPAQNRRSSKAPALKNPDGYAQMP